MYSITDYMEDYLGLKLSDGQNEAINCITNRTAIIAHRAWGKTTLAISYGAYRALTEPRSRVVILSRKRNDSDAILRRTLGLFKDKVHQYSYEKIIFKNGSEIVFASPNVISPYDYTYADLLIVDEAAYIDSKTINEWLGTKILDILLISSNSVDCSVFKTICNENNKYNVLRYPYIFGTDNRLDNLVMKIPAKFREAEFLI